VGHPDRSIDPQPFELSPGESPAKGELVDCSWGKLERVKQPHALLVHARRRSCNRDDHRNWRGRRCANRSDQRSADGNHGGRRQGVCLCHVDRSHGGQGTDATLKFGTGNVVGLDSKLRDVGGAPNGGVLKEVANGSVVTNGAFVLPATSPPYGSYSPNTAPNGTNDYAVVYMVDA